MKQIKRAFALLLTLALAISLAGCGPAEQPEPSLEASPSPSPSPTADQSRGLTVVLGDEPDTLDPAIVGDSQSMVIAQHLFEGLMTWADSGKSVSRGVNGAKLVPGQAKDYDREEKDDGTVTYTFHLRKDAKWSDGKPVTAQDFVYSWQRLVSAGNQVPYAYALECVVNASEIMSGRRSAQELAVEAVDDSTFAVTVRDVPWFLSVCALPATAPLRADVLGEAGNQWPYSPDTCVGNGPYRLSDWSQSAQIVLTRNETYYGGGDGPETITFLTADDAQTAMPALERGEVDFVRLAAGSELTGQLNKGAAYAAPYAGVYFLTFQTQKAPFNDPRIRQAFTLAVDREKLITEVVKGGQVPAGGLVPTGISDAAGDFRASGGNYYDPAAGAYQANCRKARELLAQAGYPDGAGFPEVSYLCNESAEHEAVGKALAEMWKEALGVTVTVEAQEWPVFLQSRKDGAFSIARDSWVADWDDPLTFLDRWVTGGVNNNAGYQSEGFDRLLADGKKAEGGKRMELLHQAEKQLVGGDWALCPLYFYTRPYALDQKLKGVYCDPLGSFHFVNCGR